jgi:seryl-tRNA synthetase
MLGNLSETSLLDSTDMLEDDSNSSYTTEIEQYFTSNNKLKLKSKSKSVKKNNQSSNEQEIFQIINKISERFKDINADINDLRNMNEKLFIINILFVSSFLIYSFIWYTS